MNMAKRVFSCFFALALCAAMALGSLSFMPKSFAVDDYEYPFSDSDVQSIISSSGYSSYICFASYSSSSYVFTIVCASSLVLSGSGNRIIAKCPSSPYGVYYIWRSNTSSWTSDTLTSTGIYVSSSNGNSGSPYPYSFGGNVSNSSLLSQPSTSFNYSLTSSSISSIPKFVDFMPFYFPEMPHGYFDGNINVVDGSYSVDFPSTASLDGTLGSGSDSYTFNVPLHYGDAYEPANSGTYNITNYAYSGTVSGSSGSRTISLSLSDLDSTVLYTPSYNENSRFRCWSCVMDSSYCWFVSDTRNKITGSIVSVSSDEVSWQYEFSDPQGGNTIYPIWAIVFSPMGEVIQVLSPQTVANKNVFTLTCSIGSLEQDSESGKWSVDPLYHGLWFSQDSPPVQNISYLNVGENKKYLANPVFGDSAFQLNFLDSINRGIDDINTNIQSLQTAMQTSISNQTSAIQNMDAPSAEQPDTSNMMDYFAEESVFNAPDTSSMFSGDIKTGHAWQGVTWWSSKFNDIIVSNQTIVGFTTAMLTLGLAVMIIGRRFSMR